MKTVAKSASKKTAIKKVARHVPAAPVKAPAKLNKKPALAPRPGVEVKSSKPTKPFKAAAPVAPPPEPEYVGPATPPKSVPTNGKPRKNLAGLTSRELEFFRPDPG